MSIKTSFSLAVLVSSAAFGTPIYTVTNLGYLPGQTSSQALAVNNNGQVVGTSGNRAGTWDAATHTPLQVSGTGAGASAWSVNDSGQIVGNTGANGAFFYNLITTVNVGPTTLNANPSVGAINNSGVIVGNSNSGAWMSASGAAPVFLGNFGFDTTAVEVHAINGSGVMAGAANTGARKELVSWDANGTPHAQGLLMPGGAGIAYGINNNGAVVGISPLTSSSFAPVLASGGSLISLGTLGGTLGVAYGINDAGQIVGYSMLTGFSNQHAFVYDSGQMYDLNSLVANNAGWTLNAARAINNQGVIVGEGQFNGQLTAFLLTPSGVPEPGTIVVVALGLAVIAARKKSRRTNPGTIWIAPDSQYPRRLRLLHRRTGLLVATPPQGRRD